MKRIFKLVLVVPYMMVVAPFYLVIYLYERGLNHLWPDPYDCEDDDIE